MTQRDSRIHLPRGFGAERLIIRPCRAPLARPTAAMSGWIRWGLHDRSGREVRGGEQHNLFLDSGLEEFANIANGSATTAPWDTIFNKCSVGTSSTDPDVTQTSLVAELATTTTKFGTPAWSRPSNGLYRVAITYEFSYGAANGNLTEWGIKTSGNILVVRELFRDEFGDPVTVTKTSDFLLRLTYTFEIALSPVTATAASFTITNVGVVNGDYMWVGATAPSGTGSAADLAVFGYLASGGVNAGGGNGTVALADGAHSLVYTAINQPGGTTTSSTNRASSVSNTAYTAASHARTVNAYWSTARGNFTIAQININGSINPGSAVGPGFVFVIDVADRFAKTADYTLSLEEIARVSWARA
jgi:hypothetical protein